MSKIDERAREYSARVSGGFILDDRVAAYKAGFQDAMLTPEDIGTIHKLRDDVYTELSAGKIKVMGKSDINAEVLKRFNEIKFKK